MRHDVRLADASFGATLQAAQVSASWEDANPLCPGEVLAAAQAVS